MELKPPKKINNNRREMAEFQFYLTVFKSMICDDSFCRWMKAGIVESQKNGLDITEYLIQ